MGVRKGCAVAGQNRLVHGHRVVASMSRLRRRAATMKGQVDCDFWQLGTCWMGSESGPYFGAGLWGTRLGRAFECAQPNNG